MFPSENSEDKNQNISFKKYFFQVKSVFLQWLPWFLRMSRPGKKITRKTINMNNKMNELSLKEKACKSLLANVLDMDDDLRYRDVSCQP